MTFRSLTKLGGRRFARVAARRFAPCLLVCLLCGSAAAYTVVMRGGRRVEIPAGFELTRTTLTYEAAPGVSVSLPLDHVDVEATERANGERSDSFLRRARRETGQGATRQTTHDDAPARAASRTVTNRDLEAVRRARVESERDYERRRKELGLPSAEEMRRYEERETEHMRELSRQKAEEDAAVERYRRARRDEWQWQRELFLPDAEDYYTRRGAAESFGDSDDYFSSSGITVITNGHPFYGRRFPSSLRRSPFASSRPHGFGAFGRFGAGHGPRVRRGVSLGIGVNGGTRAVVGFGRRGLRGQPAGRR